ncbi:CDGSH iron-sulfur domain-containing protein [Aromatoleum evansii]|uniref:CDGSH iron-sulfur domain-containing protein n=1 Tax=Aromatoleum evansii TaxID=59406 RepID=A0ABZ1AUR3_AROEV|nr:CDGSH iron-sulfur domain-containing protein [Aromatoleum evansii]
MNDPVPNIAQKGPYAVELEAGTDYFWCACGNSKHQPFCDGSHKGGPFLPLKFQAAATGTAYLCGCKRTGNKPYCDGTHNKL